MKSRGIFVTGTDTEVGKTVVATGLVQAFCTAGLRTAVMKPVSAGCVRREGQWLNQDAELLMAQANVELELSQVNPYAFEPPIAPHIAAAEVKVDIELDTIVEAFSLLASRADITVVEGAGGWLAPISRTQTMADIATRLSLPVVLVVGMRLGCLNHALLTAESIAATGVELAGWVANGIDPHFARAEENLRTLESLLHAPLIAKLPFLAAPVYGAAAKEIRMDLLIGCGLPRPENTD